MQNIHTMYQLLKITLSLISIFVISCQSQPKDNSEKATKPNIIYIMADDLGYGDVGCFGQKIIQTPNLDKMAEEGIRFTDHYAGTSVCAPSRCVLMTGKHMGHAEIRGNKQVQPAGQMPLSEESIAVAELVKEAGYKTALIGKWGLGIEGTSGEPTNQGFDLYYGYLDQILAHNYFPEFLIRNGEKEYLNNEVYYLPKEQWHGGLGSYATKKVDYSHDLFEEETLSFIEKNKENPFFLYLPYTIPHDNGEAPKEERLEIPDQGIYADKTDWGNDQRNYAAMVTRLDETVGKILDKLKEVEIDDNTLIIFTSDNGPEMGYYFAGFFDSNGIFKGGKRDLYEGGIREPFIARWPGKITAGAESEHISAFYDFLPTVCEIIGVEVPENVDGISYLPALTGKAQKAHDYLYWEFYERTGAKAIRKGKWKAVQNDVRTNPEAPIELYDLDKDPGEENNVSLKYPEIILEMEQIMKTASIPSKDFSF